uniref:Uncharacterized protein n=1 Tax=Trichinella nativa TaxID=6335 RepID=A0A0V1KI77_9BILA
MSKLGCTRVKGFIRETWMQNEETFRYTISVLPC